MGKVVQELPENQKILRLKTESGAEEVYYPVFHEGLPEEYKILAEQELEETATEKENGLRRLKEFMKKENLSATDDILIAVLRACKYNLQKSEQKLKSFLRSRQGIVQKLCRLDEEKIELILRDTLFTVLPYRDKHGRAIIVTKPTVNFDKYSMDDVEPVVISLLLYLLTFHMTTVCGVVYIAEGKCDSLLTLYRIAKSFKPYIYYAMDLPLRIGKADIVNETVVARWFYQAIRPLLPAKFKRRICFHGNSYKSLHSIYHTDILPEDVEGNLGPISDEFYRERLMKFMRTLKEEALRD